MNEWVFDIEVWKDCEDFPDRFEISNLGRLRRKPYIKTTKNVHGELSYKTKEKIMKSRKSPDGYVVASVEYKGRNMTVFIHRLVAKAFIPNPENKPTVNHKNSIRDDNRIENLEWATHQENVKHGYEFGKNSNAADLHPRAVLNSEIVREIRRLSGEGLSCNEISGMLGFNYHTIWKVTHGINWSSVK